MLCTGHENVIKNSDRLTQAFPVSNDSGQDNHTTFLVLYQREKTEASFGYQIYVSARGKQDSTSASSPVVSKSTSE